MGWHLAPGVTVTAVDADLVFLDVAQDVYLCLPGGADAVRRFPYGLAIDDAGLASDLLAAGLIRERKDAAPPLTPAPTPTGDLVGRPRPRPDVGEIVAFGMTVAAMGRRYHGRTLQEMIAHATRRGQGGRRTVAREPDPAVVRRATLFDALLPWAPRQEACLYRSFMLLQFLGELGREAVWVFGVRTRPFEAHCWIQAGPLVLNDSAEHVLSYAPILVT